MSTTISTTTMIAKLQQKCPIGLGATDWLYLLNEAFRKIDQSQKGGFIWQLKPAVFALAPGPQVITYLPDDFDPGKTAVMYGSATTGTRTLIPYLPVSEWVNEEHFGTTAIAMFSSWTFYPAFTFTAPTSYKFIFRLAPTTAFPLAAPTALNLYYHAVSYPALTNAANVYFPTPDQFDSLIMDLAEAEARRIYTLSGWEKLAASATQGINELIDTYRTDRYDLAGVSDVVVQAQEKSAERDR